MTWPSEECRECRTTEGCAYRRVPVSVVTACYELAPDFVWPTIQRWLCESCAAKLNAPTPEARAARTEEP
jgi:hypothetical protein